MREGAGYTTAERRSLAAALARGEAPACPVCGGLLARRPVDPGGQVGYVRHRVWLICTGCKRSAAVDVPDR